MGEKRILFFYDNINLFSLIADGGQKDTISALGQISGG